MEKVKPYEKYKESGVEWAGIIPVHWEVQRLKYLAECFPSNVDKHSREGEQQVRLCNYTDVYKNDFIVDSMKLMVATATNEQIARFTLYKGDVIITKDSETADDIGVPTYVREDLSNVICGYHLSVVRPRENVDGKYLFRLLQNKGFNSQLEVLANGVTRVALGVYDLNNVIGLKPPPQEQTAIARFLDYKTGQIDRFIRKKKQLIKLLNEQKAAIINHAVTKGINPNAPMKDSGIEWLGEIPAHWEVKPLKYYVTCNDEALPNDTSDDFALRYIDIGNVNESGEISEIVRYDFKDAPSRARRIVREGDVIVSTVRTYLKAITHITEDADDLIVSTGFAVLRPKSNTVSDYLNYAVRAAYFIETVCANSYGVSYPAINSTELVCLKLAMPFPDEQLEIVGYINKETEALRTTIAMVQKEIALCEEYRTALIAEAVTGKIDVREYKIPETVGSDEQYEDIEEELSIAAEDEAEYETQES